MSQYRYLKKKPETWIDYFIYVFVFATPLFEIPQVYTIFKNQSAADVSVVTWVLFLLSSIFWLIYAIKYSIKPLILCYLFYLVVETFVVTGILIYR